MKTKRPKKKTTRQTLKAKSSTQARCPKPPPEQRQIGDPITIKKVLYQTDIEMTISATYEGWKKLKFYLNETVRWKIESGQRLPEFLKDDLLISFVLPALDQSKEEKANPGLGPYGSNLPKRDAFIGDKDTFSRNMQIISALLNVFFSYWLERPPKSRPALLTDLEMSDDFKEDFHGKAINAPSFYTAWCMESVFGEARERLKIKKAFYDVKQDSGRGEADKYFYDKYIRRGMLILKKSYENITLDAVHSAHQECLLQSCRQALPKTRGAALVKYQNIYQLVWNLLETFLAVYARDDSYNSIPDLTEAIVAKFPQVDSYEDRARRLGLLI